jgi:AI-2 transport protein TqsA
MLLTAAGAVVTVAELRAASGIAGPAFLALVIVISIHPLLAWLQRHRVPSWLTVVLTAVPLSLFVKALLVDADPASRWLVPLIDPGSERRSGGMG